MKTIILLLALCCAQVLFSQGSDLVEQTDEGLINWSQGFIEAEGFVVIDNDKYKNPRQAEALAKRGAIVVAKANLLEMTKGLTIVRETKVKDFMTESDEITARVEGTVAGARQIGKSEVVDGIVTVRVRMSLYGPGGLGDAVIDEVRDEAKKNKKEEVSEYPNPSQADLEEYTTKTYRTIPKSADETSQILVDKPTDGTEVEEVVIPKVAFNLKGFDVNPALFPVIVDQDGNILFDFSELYDQVDGQYGLYINLAKELLEELQVKKGVEIIDAVQKSSGVFEVQLDENKKSSKFWRSVLSVGKKVLPLLIGML